jgi:hypothetical protein
MCRGHQIKSFDEVIEFLEQSPQERVIWQYKKFLSCGHLQSRVFWLGGKKEEQEREQLPHFIPELEVNERNNSSTQEGR